MKRDHKSAFFNDYELVGDDFFLTIAQLDCHNKLEYLPSKAGYKGMHMHVPERYRHGIKILRFQVVQLENVASVFLVSTSKT